MAGREANDHARSTVLELEETADTSSNADVLSSPRLPVSSETEHPPFAAMKGPRTPSAAAGGNQHSREHAAPQARPVQHCVG